MNRKTVIEIGAAVVGFLALGFFHQQMLAGLLAAAGNNHKCPWPAVLDSVATAERQLAMTAKMRQGSRQVDKDAAAGLELWETPRGKFWIPAGSGKDIFHDLGEQERGIYTPNGHGVRAGDVVLDCGANIGVYAREALARGASKVVAVEPVPQLVECLRRNLKEEIAAGKVIVFPKGVWDRDAVLPMHMNPDNAAAHTFVGERAQSNAVVNLPLTTIDQMVGELGIERVDHIKFDIEGAERKAIAGARETIRTFRPRLAVCVYHLPDDPEAIPAAVRSVRQDYAMACGPCMVSEKKIFAEVFFFE